MKFEGASPSEKEWYDNKKTYKHKPTIVQAIQVIASFDVETLEGTLKGKPFGYLVQGTKGEFYPVDKQIFESIYEVDENE